MSAPQARPRKRPHQGTTAEQLEAVDRLATETAAELAQIKSALVVMGILELAPPAGQPQMAPHTRHLRLLPGGAA